MVYEEVALRIDLSGRVFVILDERIGYFRGILPLEYERIVMKASKRIIQSGSRYKATAMNEAWQYFDSYKDANEWLAEQDKLEMQTVGDDRG